MKFLSGKKMKSVLFVGLILSCVVVSYFSFAQENIGINDLKPQQNPVIREDGLYFYYYPKSNRKMNIYLKSSFDNWKSRFEFKDATNYDYNIRYYVCHLPNKDPLFQLKPGDYEYLFLVDELYASDPLSQNRKVNMFGEEISIFTLKDEIHYIFDTPRKVKDTKGTYRFYYRDFKAQFVYLVGSFNDYDPYATQMKNIRNGIYMAEISLTPGKKYYYSFIVNKVWRTDPLNDKVGQDTLNRKLSIYTAE